MHIVLPATLATAAACGLISLWLAIRIGQVRRVTGVWTGDGGDARVIARMRAQSNFVEYAPFVLILLALLELAKGPSPFAWAYGAAFVAARLFHPFGMDGWKLGRQIGAILTMLVLLLLSIECAWTAYGISTPVKEIPIHGVPAA